MPTSEQKSSLNKTNLRSIGKDKLLTPCPMQNTASASSKREASFKTSQHLRSSQTMLDRARPTCPTAKPSIKFVPPQNQRYTANVRLLVILEQNRGLKTTRCPPAPSLGQSETFHTTKYPLTFPMTLWNPLISVSNPAVSNHVYHSLLATNTYKQHLQTTVCPSPTDFWMTGDTASTPAAQDLYLATTYIMAHQLTTSTMA